MLSSAEVTPKFCKICRRRMNFNCTTVNTNNITTINITINGSFASGSLALILLVRSASFAMIRVATLHYYHTASPPARLYSIASLRSTINYYHQQHRRWGRMFLLSFQLLIRLRLLRNHYSIPSSPTAKLE